jgi:hypothetical protein
MGIKNILLVIAFGLTTIQLFAQADSLKVSAKYYSSYQLGLMFNCIACESNNRLNISTLMLHGVSLNDKHVIAIGIGREAYGGLVSRPLIFHLERYYKGFTGQYGFVIDTGTAFIKTQQEEWGWFGQLERGRAFVFHPQFIFTSGERNAKIQIAAGYKFVRADLMYNNWGMPTWVDMDLSRFTFNVGLRIN